MYLWACEGVILGGGPLPGLLGRILSGNLIFLFSLPLLFSTGDVLFSVHFFDPPRKLQPLRGAQLCLEQRAGARGGEKDPLQSPLPGLLLAALDTRPPGRGKAASHWRDFWGLFVHASTWGEQYIWGAAQLPDKAPIGTPAPQGEAVCVQPRWWKYTDLWCVMRRSALGGRGWTQTRGRDSVSPSDAGQSDTFLALASLWSPGVGIQLTFYRKWVQCFSFGKVTRLDLLACSLCLLLDSSTVHLVRGGWKSSFIPNQVLVPCLCLSFFPLFSGQARTLRPVIWSYPILIHWRKFDCEVGGW